jgi:hypothetical protein
MQGLRKPFTDSLPRRYRFVKLKDRRIENFRDGIVAFETPHGGLGGGQPAQFVAALGNSALQLTARFRSIGAHLATAHGLSTTRGVSQWKGSCLEASKTDINTAPPPPSVPIFIPTASSHSQPDPLLTLLIFPKTNQPNPSNNQNGFHQVCRCPLLRWPRRCCPRRWQPRW